MAKFTPALIRFWEKVRSDSPQACWEWIGRRLPFGHGHFDVAHGQPMLAHRYSWELVNGTIPDDLCVLHRCDNPPCVNPAHLFLGTRTDNNRDKSAKGRHHNQRKVTCIRGHAFTSENTAVRRDGRRYCRSCWRATNRLRMRRVYAARRANTQHQELSR